jgi:integrase/recombinase XerD
MRTPSAKTQSAPLDHVITDTLKLWRKHHLTYDQTRYVAKAVRQALAITRPTTRPRVIVRLSHEEEQRLIGQAYRMPGVRGLLIKTLFQTGARVSEFVHLQVPDVYFEEQMLLITQAKGGKQRYVPLLPELTHELRTYLRERATGPLFVTRRHTRYSPRRIQQLVQETAALAGITKRVHPHLLRHSVATTLLERGMPLEQIQQFLGHAKLETTQIYAASTTAMIKDSYQKALGR